MKKFILFSLLLLAPISAGAWEAVDAQNVSVTVSYMEPTENTDGSVLVDLAEIRTFYTLGDGPIVEGHVELSSPTGGANVSFQMIIPAAKGQTLTLSTWSISYTEGGVQSEPSSIVTLEIFRAVPNPPVKLGVK